jgi:hypothetical protein
MTSFKKNVWDIAGYLLRRYPMRGSGECSRETGD